MTQTVEKPRVSGPGDTGLGGHWRVIVLNDDHNKGMGMANQIHNSGRAIVWSGARELAEHYWEQLGGHGLTLAPLEQG